MQTHQPDIFTDKNERNDFYIALLIIVLAGIFITQTALVHPDNKPAQHLISDSNEPLDSLVTNTTKDLQLDEPKSIRKEQVAIVRNKYIAPKDKVVAENVSSNSNKVELTISSNAHDDALLGNDEIDYSREEVSSGITQKTSTIVEKSKPTVGQLSDDMPKGKIIGNNKDIALDTETKDALSSALRDDDSKNDECIIAIGLYKESKNIRNLKNRLSSGGFDVFTKELRSMTQVGVYISCDPTISKSVLSEIKEIYAQDAFIVTK